MENEKDEKKKSVAKDLVELKHVEVKKQEISQDTKELADVIKTQGLTQDQSDELSNDEITILESFIGKRLFLTRIAIVVNQSRIPLGIEPFKKAELEQLLESLINKGFIDFSIVEDKHVYFLTEKGKECIQ
ncbi:MAG: hypothetical protein ACTSPS_13285 [Promethearchaeota archaeon]